MAMKKTDKTLEPQRFGYWMATPFKQGIRGSNPRRVTNETARAATVLAVLIFSAFARFSGLYASSTPSSR
jgi:hypothetical protein